MKANKKIISLELSRSFVLDEKSHNPRNLVEISKYLASLPFLSIAGALFIVGLGFLFLGCFIDRIGSRFWQSPFNFIFKKITKLDNR